MTRTLLTLVVLAAPGGALLGGEPAQPRGMAPQFLVVGLDRDGNAVLKQTITGVRPETRTEQVKEGDRVVTRSVPVMVTFQAQNTIPLSNKKIEVYRADGKRVTAAEVARLITGDTPVLVSSDGKMVDAVYLRLVREGTLVVVAPPDLLNLPPVAPVPLPPAPAKVPAY